jgi:ABC-2 type transport system permease protein
VAAAPHRSALAEVTKLGAFARRDLLDAWSYRASFFTDVAGMVVQLVTFYFIGKIVNAQALPEFGGKAPTYVEFVATGIVLNVFVQVGLNQVATALRQEQWRGTLESVLMTPTALTTIQLGSVIYDLVYIPLRTIVFLIVVAVTFDVDLQASGIVPATVVVLFFVPFVWGLGLISAGGVLTFKGGNVGVGIATTLLTIASGAYFPLELLPDWLTPIAEANPLAIAIDGIREALIGGSEWSGVAGKLAILVPASAVALGAGVVAFRLALARERRRGSLALY